MHLGKYGMTRGDILKGGRVEFEHVESPRREKEPMYLASIVDKVVEDAFEDLRESLQETDALTEENSELLYESLDSWLAMSGGYLDEVRENTALAKRNNQLTIDLYESRITSNPNTKKELFSLLMTMIDLYELENILDLRDHLVKYGKNIHVRAMNDILTYNTELVAMLFDAVRQERQQYDAMKDAAECDREWLAHWKVTRKMQRLVRFISDSKQPASDRFVAIDCLSDCLTRLIDDDTLDDLTKGYRDTEQDTNVGVGYNQEAVSTFIRNMSDRYSEPYPSEPYPVEMTSSDELWDDIDELLDDIELYEKSLPDAESQPEELSCFRSEGPMTTGFDADYTEIDRYFVDYTPKEIERTRKTHGLSQKQFAKELGVATTTVRSWVDGTYSPSSKNMYAINTFVYEQVCKLDKRIYLLPNAIKIIRDNCKLSMSALANELDVPVYIIKRWESGADTPSEELATRIKSLLAVSNEME